MSAHGSYKPAGLAGWGERVTCDELIQVPAAWAARGEPTSRASGRAGCFGREGTPGIHPDRQRSVGRGPGRPTWPGASSLAIEIGWRFSEKGGVVAHHWFDLVFSGHGPEALNETQLHVQLARAGCEENVVNFILKANRCATASSDGSVSCESNVIEYIHKANKPAL